LAGAQPPFNALEKPGLGGGQREARPSGGWGGGRNPRVLGGVSAGAWRWDRWKKTPGGI